MKLKKIMCMLLATGVMMATACGSTEQGAIKEESIAESANTISDNEIDEVEFEDSAVIEDEVEIVIDEDEYVPTPMMSEEEVLLVYEFAIASSDYEKAGSEIYRWLRENDSKEVQEKYDYIRDIVYGSRCVVTAYDENDVELDHTSYRLDKRGNVIEESYYLDNEKEWSYSYNYVYDGDQLIEQFCYDDDGDIIYNWEGILNDSGDLVTETTTYNNLLTGDTTEHVFDENGRCVEEHMIYAGEDGVATEQYVEFDYNEDGNMIEERYYTADKDLFQKYVYTYNEKGLRETIEYFDENDELQMSYEFDYNDKDQLIWENCISGEHVEYTEYTYDKFGNDIEHKFYQHDELVSTITYEYDFLGNVVIEKTVDDSGTVTLISDYTYELR